MNKNLFEGNIVRLRAMEESDWESFYEMDLDSETQRHSWMVPFPRSMAAAKEWAKKESLKSPEKDEFRFVIEHLADGTPAGTLNTHSLEPGNGSFGYGLGIHPAYRRKGCASEAILLLLNYFFKELRYHKCTVSIFSFNHASYELHKKLGFVHEGTLREMEYSNGTYYDHIMFGMTSTEFDALYGERFKIELPFIRS
ncbi:MAG: GNAT family protein [Anaerolineae bacterium]|jgi:RimJ/RimL family protein N-acetyltransferase|nr:GNAT family protein [Anaerolineae bacterium]